MRLQIDATEEELIEKQDQLITALAEVFPGIEKSISGKAVDKELKYPALQQILQQTSKMYREQIQQMLDDIQKVIDGTATKSVRTPIRSQPEDHTKSIANKEQKQYQLVKDKLIKQGATHKDFDKGGRYYGMSISQLNKITDNG